MACPELTGARSAAAAKILGQSPHDGRRSQQTAAAGNVDIISSTSHTRSFTFAIVVAVIIALGVVVIAAFRVADAAPRVAGVLPQRLAAQLLHIGRVDGQALQYSRRGVEAPAWQMQKSMESVCSESGQPRLLAI